MKAGIINIGVDLANLSPEQQNNESWDRNYYVSAASCKTEGADPSVIYEDRHLEVMNKRPVAKRKPSVHIQPRDRCSHVSARTWTWRDEASVPGLF